MKRVKYSLALCGLLLALWPTMSIADFCGISFDCPCGPDIGCGITAAPGNTTSCWVGPGNEVTCCEFNIYGTPIRDVHRSCTSGCGGGGGGPGGGEIPK